jgi:signal transduction histidine kinase
VLATVARQAGPAVHAAQLTAELQRSRQALVAAQEEERRRLRRDLHDGLGPQLASQALTIDVILRTLERDPAQARALLADLKQQSQDAIRDIRRVIYALRPPALDDLGLLTALREQAARHEQAGLRIQVVADPEPLPPLHAAVEVAAYRIVQEALTNVLRHAQARACTVTIRAAADVLTVSVADDGRGLPASNIPGVGMQSMRERAAELGGVCRVERLPAGGTRVEAALPLQQAATV